MALFKCFLLDFPGVPVVESLPSIRQIKSSLSFNASASDDGAVYACAAFAPRTMDVPSTSKESLRLNVTCKENSCIYLF